MNTAESTLTSQIAYASASLDQIHSDLTAGQPVDWVRVKRVLDVTARRLENLSKGIKV